VDYLEKIIAALEASMEHKGGDMMSEAKHFNGEVIPAMKAVRDVADKLETVVADDLWPLPNYREMLFIK
jgi:glutamine synthetase